MERYVYQPDARVSFEEGVRVLQQQGRTVVNAAVNITVPAVLAEVRVLGARCGMDFQPLEVDVDAFRAYYEAAGYSDRYAEYYRGNQQEKALEHFIALRLLSLTGLERFIDVASEHSPVPEIYERLTGAETYSQDIMYPPGVEGRRIGGDACAMPLPDGFASTACLTCSLEHFEGDADLRLFRELARVLRPGGAVCVVPFYVNVGHVVQTDPTLAVPANVAFDVGAPIYCAQGWSNRHGRFYSPTSFMERIARPVANQFQFTFFEVTNAPAVHPSAYVRFAFLATRR